MQKKTRLAFCSNNKACSNRFTTVYIIYMYFWVRIMFLLVDRKRCQLKLKRARWSLLSFLDFFNLPEKKSSLKKIKKNVQILKQNCTEFFFTV